MKTTMTRLGISQRAALENMGISMEAYEKHCSRFFDSYRGSADELREMLIQSRTGDAAVYVHSIKGLAATLGFTELSQAAADLEAALKSGVSCYGELQTYTAALSTLLNE